MKKLFNFRLLVLIGVLIMSIPQMWAWTINKGNVYFVAPENWTGSVVQLVGNTSGNDYCWTFTNVSNTKLYYLYVNGEAGSWSFDNWYFMANSSAWQGGDRGWSYPPSATNYTSTKGYNINSQDGWYLFVGSDLSDTWLGTNISPKDNSNLQKAQTVNVIVDGNTPDASPAQIVLSSYYMSTNPSTVTNSTETIAKDGNTLSKTYTAVIGARVTLTRGTTNSGYYFVGWYDSSGNLLSSEDEYSYWGISATTVTARFETRYTINVSNNNPTFGSITKPVSPETSVTAGYYTSAAINASANPGYYFTNWTKNNNNVSFGSSTSTASNSVTATGTATVTANFAERYILRGSSKNNDANLYGLAGWSATSNSSYASNSISDGVLTITANLTKAKTDYKCLIQDLKDNARKGQTGTGYIGDNESWTLDGTNDVYFTSTAVGTYTFTYNLSSGSFKVVHPAHYSVTYSYDTGGSSVTATVSGETIGSSPGYAVSGANVVMTATAAPGYTFSKWVDGSGNEVSTSNPYTISSINADKTLVAKFTPNTHTLRFNLNGGNNYSSYGSASESAGVVTMNVTYGQVLNELTLPYAIKNAYHFETWSTSDTYMYSGDVWKYYYAVVPRVHGWDAETGYVVKDGDNYIWRNTSANGTTIDLYAHYGEPNTPHISFSPDHAVPEGEVTATILYSEVMGQPEGEYTLCYKLTTAGGIVLKVQPELSQNDAARTVTFTAPASPGEYSLGVKLYPGTGATWETADPIAPFDGNCTGVYAFDKFEVEAMNAVTVSYMSGTAELRPSITAYATYSNPATLTAPDIPGMEFDRWTFTGSAYLKTGYEATDKTVEVRATGTGTATATYTQGSLFFKDTKGWGQVYVYFYSSTSYWHTESSKPEGTGSKSDDPTYGSHFISGPHAMTLLDGTDDVYYYDGDAPAYAAVAFTKEEMAGYQFFAGKTADTDPCHVVYVNAFDVNKPMIVPIGEGALWNQGYAHYYAHDLAPLLQDWGATVRTNLNWTDVSHKLKSAKMGDLSFSTTIYFDRKSYNYQWAVWNESESRYSVNKVGETLHTINYNSPITNTLTTSSDNMLVKTNLPGEYTFTITYSTETTASETHDGAATSDGLWKHATVTVTYPVNVGDYRLVYDDDNLNPHPSDIIQKKNDGEQIVNMFYNPDATPVMKVQSCTNVAIDKGDDVDPITWSLPTILSLSSFSSVLTDTSVYNFTIKQDADGLNPVIDKVEKYTGRFYVRTDSVNEDHWNYKNSKDAHAMTYSEWSATKMEDKDMRFSHYFVKDIHGSNEHKGNIRFTVATDYSEAICDTVIDGDATGKWKDYFHSEQLSQTANVRFTYDQKRNKVWRAYTEGPENPWYMVLNGDHIYKSTGGVKGDRSDTLKFVDMNNWVYQVDAYADVNSYIKLTAKINGTTNYLRGKEGNGDDEVAYTADDGVLLVGGTGDAQHMRVTYDFKTDRMMTSWLPSGPVSGTLDIHADIMLLRTHQEGATSITFNSGGKLTDVKTAYGVMEFQKDYINDYSLSRYERNLYWISFPFDVNLSDVFGFGNYGEHWIIEYYDGKGRAEKGYWAESEPNWKFVTEEVKDEFVLKANEGYILALALSNMTEYSDIWANSVTSVYLYFPSANTIGNLSNVSSVTVEMDTVGYKCKITRDNRHIKDSYWRCIGVPSYALSTRTGLPTSAPDNWETKVPYVYIWNSINNSLAITSSAEVNFEAMHSYLIQYPDDKMVWTNVTNVPAGVMRRRVEGNNASFYEWNLNLLNNGQHIDHTYVRLSNDENVTDGYDFGNDLSKEFNSGSNIYTFVDDVEVAGNVKPIRTETTIVPVGVKIATTGEYTFSMPEGTNGVGVILVDNIAGTRTNLALEDYTVNLTQGNIDNRFFLEISPIVQSPTDIEQTSSDSKDGVRKVMVDGILYIVKDGKVFDARGSRLQ